MTEARCDRSAWEPDGGAGCRERAEAEQKRAAEALRQAEADLAHVSRVTTTGELTASLAHEVNQPITAAVTNANTCVRWLAGDSPNIQEARCGDQKRERWNAGGGHH